MPVHLLVVDDEPDIVLLFRQHFRAQIRSEGWRFTFLHNGDEALQAIESGQPVDVLLTDINMPGMDGLTLLSKLHAEERPFKSLVVSAYSDLAYIRTAMNRGAFDFVTKPISVGDLKAAIQKTLHAVRQQRSARQAHEQLIQIRKELEISRRVEEVQARFFANLSHEFRTPLTLILGPIEDALAGAQCEVGHLPISHFTSMRRQALHLKALIDQLLDLSKLRDGHLQLRARQADLAFFVEDIVRSFSTEAERKGVTLRFIAPETECELYFDPDRLQRVVINLLSNAMKFTSEGGTIRVGVAPAGEDEVEIEVRDSGAGIPADALPYVFERFYQVDSSQRLAGTGIGLAIAKELTERHGGKLSATSEVGFGSSFCIRLPRGTGHLASSDFADPEETQDIMPIPWAADGDDLLAEDDGELRDEKAPLVLMAEDHGEMRAYISGHLRRRYRVVGVDNGKSALEEARRSLPDLIVCDVMLPGLNGLDLCRSLRADEGTADIPIMIITAKAEIDDRLAGLESGADDYITKPFNVRELLTRAENLIEIRRMLRSRYSGEVVLHGSKVSVPSADAEFLKRVHNEIEARMGTPSFSIGDVAREVGISPRHLRRKLHELTGLSPSGFVRSLRLERARQLLQQRTGTVSEIAYKVGFLDPKYFSRLFRQVYRELPSEVERQAGPDA